MNSGSVTFIYCLRLKIIVTINTLGIGIYCVYIVRGGLTDALHYVIGTGIARSGNGIVELARVHSLICI